jgi:hypothetical protein
MINQEISMSHPVLNQTIPERDVVPLTGRAGAESAWVASFRTQRSHPSTNFF